MNRKIGYSLSILLAWLILLPSLCSAHFVWVYGQDGKIRLVLGEDLEPDQDEYLDGLKQIEARIWDGKQWMNSEGIRRTQDGLGWWEWDDRQEGTCLAVSSTYGVFQRGEKSMLLDYHARTITKVAAIPHATNLAPLLPLDLIPVRKDSRLELHVFHDGKPAGGIEVSFDTGDQPTTVTTGNDGVVLLPDNVGRAIRAKTVKQEPGNNAGQPYNEHRIYCTLVLPQSKDYSPATITPVTHTLGLLENGMTSFGATVVDDQIIVVGGKSGRAHAYAKSFQNRNVFGLNWKQSGSQWKVLTQNLGLQGLAVVSFGDSLIRVGGLEARNQEGEDHDLHSTQQVLRWNPKSDQWTDLPSLPSGRSSLDACVGNGRLWVAGGWTLAGDKEPVWATDVLSLDLTRSDSQWKSHPAPFKTRALAARIFQGSLIVIGGIQAEGGTTNQVHMLNLETGDWTTGPALPTEDAMKAFGCSAVALKDHFLVSTYDGSVFRLSDDRQQWDKIYQLDEGRFFHQMLPLTDDQFALVGGSHSDFGHQKDVEIYRCQPNQTVRLSETVQD